MAKKMAAGMTCPVCPTWFGVLVVLVGLWFVLADLGILSTGGIGLWPVVILLIGLKMWAESK